MSFLFLFLNEKCPENIFLQDQALSGLENILHNAKRPEKRGLALQ